MPLLVSPATAKQLNLETKDLVELELNGKKVKAPVWIQAGHADNCVTVSLGYGRWRAGRAGTGAGFNMYELRYSATPWFANGAVIRNTGAKYVLASTQGYQTMETQDGGDRPLVRPAALRSTARAQLRDGRGATGSSSRSTPDTITRRNHTPGA